MIDRLIEAIEVFLTNREDQENLEMEIDFVSDELRCRLNEDILGENTEAMPVLPITETLEELKFIRNNIFLDVCYEPDILKSLDSLRTFSMFFKSSGESSLDKCDKCPDIHADIDIYFDELLTDIPENRFLTAN